MSTNRSKDRSSLCSFMYVDCRHRPVSSRAQRRIRFRRRSGGLQTGQGDGRERPWCPVPPAFRGGLLFANPEGSEGSAFCPGTSAKPSSKSCPSPKTNASTPTTPIPGAKPSAPPMSSLPITCRPIPSDCTHRSISISSHFISKSLRWPSNATRSGAERLKTD